MSSVANSPAPVSPNLYFERFELQVYERQLLADGEPLALGGRAFDVLLALAQRAGQLVTKNELLDQVWPGLVVEEHNIAAQISLLRKLLGLGIIATVPGRGYRFTARVAHCAPHSNGTGEPINLASAGTIADETLAISPPQSAHAKPLTNLPWVLTSMIGRETELAELTALVAAQQLVTVVGAGGIGKTLLVQHLLQTQQQSFEHGVCWVDLAAIADADAVAPAIAAALGSAPGRGEALAGLCASVAPLHVMLALDNAEHLLDAVARVAQALCAAAPRLRLVVTSQASLNLRTEHVYRLHGLRVPADSALNSTSAADCAAPRLTVAQALSYGAVDLFAQRARAANHRFELTDANLLAVCGVCRALDGCTLAIELAAARSSLLGAQGVLAALDSRLRLLTRGHRDAPARQQTLLATLDWSHSLLMPAEQTVLRRMAVFAGSAALADVQAVVADPSNGNPPDIWGSLDALAVLVDRSFVSLVSVSGSDEPRYRLLETPRAYALERLVAAGEVERARGQHAQVIARRVEPLASQGADIDLLWNPFNHGIDPDRDNATEAWTWARQNADERTQRMLGTLLLHTLPYSMYALRTAVAESVDPSTDTPLGRGSDALQMWWWLGVYRHWFPARPRESRQSASQCVACTEAASHVPGHALRLFLVKGVWAQVCAQAGNASDADIALAEMASLLEPGWPVSRRIKLLGTLVVASKSLGRATDALRYSREWGELSRVSGRDEVLTLRDLSDAELAAGNTLAAVEVSAKLLALLEGSRDEIGLCYTRLNACAALLASNQVATALPLARKGWLQAAQFDTQAYWADHLALLAALRGWFESAAKLIGYADAGYMRNEDRREPNEDAAVARARTLAVAALGQDTFDKLRLAGESLNDGQIGAIAFGD